MTIRVIREPSINGTTQGIVFVDDRFFGFSVEDQLREVKGQPVASWKVAGETAIPAGRYLVALTMSPHFGRVTPELLNVPGFTGIRVHPGNYAKDTEGCLLVGLVRAEQAIRSSGIACQQLQASIEAAASRGEQCWALVENPLSY